MPKVIAKEVRLQVKKCYRHFKDLHPSATTNDRVYRLKDIFGISEATIFNILRTKDEDIETSGIGRRGKTNFWDFMFQKDLQRLIWRYNAQNTFYTLDSLLEDAKNELEYQGGRTTLFKIFKSMGYKYKLVNGRKILCERKHVLGAKIKFLRKFLELQKTEENVIFVYLDETWIYQNGSPVRRWVHESDIKSNPSKIKSEGKRFTILHAGCHLGFLEGCGYFLDSGNNDRDYHNTLNGERFQNWVVNQLIPALSKLPGKVVVVFDNAPYHSMQVDKPPNFSCKKSQMQEWLVNHGVELAGKFTKKQLWTKIQPFRNSEKRYVIDCILMESGYEVLRLPPYHCQYNPIELAWGFCKTYYNKHINSQPSSKDKVQNLWREALSKCTPDYWQNYCEHTEKLIANDWKQYMGNLTVNSVPPVIISLGESDSDSDMDWDSDSSD